MPPFFPYHPRRARWVLVAASVLALALTARALVLGVQAGDWLAYARGGLSLGFTLTMLVVHHRLRSREGWGVTLSPLALVVGKPFGGDITVPWGQVAAVDRQGDALAVRDHEGGRVLVPRFLFENEAAFEALAQALARRQQA